MCQSWTCSARFCCVASAVQITPALLGTDGRRTSSGYDVISTKKQCEPAIPVVGLMDDD